MMPVLVEIAARYINNLSSVAKELQTQIGEKSTFFLSWVESVVREDFRTLIQVSSNSIYFLSSTLKQVDNLLLNGEKNPLTLLSTELNKSATQIQIAARYIFFVNFVVVPNRVLPNIFLLKEDGAYLLLESGDKIILNR